MAAPSIQVCETPLVLYALRRADDALILGHRLSEWCGHAPMLEEDMALANMGLDLLGQARELYSFAALVEGKDNDEDKFAYLRDVRQYRNLLLVEQPNGDFAHTMVRQFFYAAFADLYWRAMMKSSDATLAAIAAKSEKECAYHLRHSSEWLIRLGDGTAESHARAQAAIDDLWSFTGEMFEVDDSERALVEAGIAVNPAVLQGPWFRTVSGIVGEATLALPGTQWMQKGGRSGRHSEHLGHLLSELQSMQRTFPDASW
jgi:ring-1,2-phenylacetyl-CoA epoxidase subunit PaaC